MAKEAKDQDQDQDDLQNDLDLDIDHGGTPVDTEKKKEDAPKVEVEVIDDLPDEDRRVLESRKRKLKDKEDDELPPLPDKEDELDKEIAEYGKRSQTRIKQLYGRFHDERRAKEAALRSHEEAMRYAERVVDENKKYRDTLARGEQYLVEKVKKNAEMALDAAKRKYKEAFDLGDAEAIAKATEEMSVAIAEKREAESFKSRDALQPEKKSVQDEQGKEAVSDQPQRRAQAPDPRAVSWAEQNKWFGQDEEMTAFAYGLHQKLVLRENVDPRSEEYYERINKEIRRRFPEKFETSSSEGERPRKQSAPSRTVVAGVSRAPASKKVTLTATQAALAKRLGVPLELYAEQVLKESGNA